MRTLALVCTENSKWMAASFPQCNVSVLSQSQGHFVFTVPSSSLLSDSPYDLFSILSALLTSLAWPTLLASFLPVSCVPLSQTVPSPVLTTQTVSSPPIATTFVLLSQILSFLNPPLCFIAGSSVVFKYLCPYALCERTNRLNKRFARSLLCS